jgi:hypothetical protein
LEATVADDQVDNLVRRLPLSPDQQHKLQAEMIVAKKTLIISGLIPREKWDKDVEIITNDIRELKKTQLRKTMGLEDEG